MLLRRVINVVGAGGYGLDPHFSMPWGLRTAREAVTGGLHPSRTALPISLAVVPRLMRDCMRVAGSVGGGV